MKIKFMYLIAISALLFAGCKKDKPLSQEAQKDVLESTGIELLDYADVEKWGDAYTAFAKFARVISDSNNDATVFETLGDSIEIIDETNTEDNYAGYGWYCNYQTPGTITYEKDFTIQLANAKGAISLDPAKKAWVKEDASSLTIKADVDNVPMTANVSIATNTSKSLLSESINSNYSEWPAYTTGPAMFYEKIHYEENGGYDSWEPVTRNNGDTIEYHFYNPVTNADLGWFSENDIYSNYNTFSTMVAVEAGRHEEQNIRKSYIYVPKSIKADFTNGIEKIAGVDINIDYKPADASKIDIAKDQLNADFSFSASGYTLKSTKLNYLTDAAESSISFSYGKKRIFLLSAKENGMKVESKTNESKNDYDNGNGYKNGSSYTSTSYKISAVPTSAEFTFDLLGEVKITGSADIKAASDYSDKLEQNRTNEDEFKSLLAKAEQTIKINAYYDGSKTCSAHFGLEPEKKNDEWTAIPVIRFDDGSSYALLSEFFDEADFADLIKAYEDWQSSVEKYISSVFQPK